jgi:hypothetical protein
MAACRAARAIQFRSGDPDLLLANWGCSTSTVEAGEDKQVEDMMNGGVRGDVVEGGARGVFIHGCLFRRGFVIEFLEKVRCVKLFVIHP